MAFFSPQDKVMNRHTGTAEQNHPVACFISSVDTYRGTHNFITKHLNADVFLMNSNNIGVHQFVRRWMSRFKKINQDVANVHKRMTRYHWCNLPGMSNRNMGLYTLGGRTSHHKISSHSQDFQVYTFPIALEFDRRIGSSAADMPGKF